MRFRYFFILLPLSFNRSTTPWRLLYRAIGGMQRQFARHNGVTTSAQCIATAGLKDAGGWFDASQRRLGRKMTENEDDVGGEASGK